MKIYVNGDSHSAGFDAGGPNHSYGFHLSRFLKTDFVCDAKPGCANETILRTTKQYLNTNRPDIVIIGWTTWEREEWIHENEHIYVTSSGLDRIPKDLQSKYMQWVIDSGTRDNQKQKELFWHDRIWQFHNELKLHQIPHLFFNCYNYFHHVKHWNIPKYDWDEHFINPYDENFTYYFWLQRKGLKPSNPKYYHYGADAHLIWAEFLLPYVSRQLTNI